MAVYERIAQQVNEMYKELYVGQGKDNPSLMTRVFNVEVAIGEMRKMRWALLVGAIAAIGDIVASHFKFHF